MCTCWPSCKRFLLNDQIRLLPFTFTFYLLPTDDLFLNDQAVLHRTANVSVSLAISYFDFRLLVASVLQFRAKSENIIVKQVPFIKNKRMVHVNAHIPCVNVNEKLLSWICLVGAHFNGRHANVSSLTPKLRSVSPAIHMSNNLTKPFIKERKWRPLVPF